MFVNAVTQRTGTAFAQRDAESYRCPVWVWNTQQHRITNTVPFPQHVITFTVDRGRVTKRLLRATSELTSVGFIGSVTSLIP